MWVECVAASFFLEVEFYIICYFYFIVLVWVASLDHLFCFCNALRVFIVAGVLKLEELILVDDLSFWPLVLLPLFVESLLLFDSLLYCVFDDGLFSISNFSSDGDSFNLYGAITVYGCFRIYYLRLVIEIKVLAFCSFSPSFFVV